jgi:hypothetical protein
MGRGVPLSGAVKNKRRCCCGCGYCCFGGSLYTSTRYNVCTCVYTIICTISRHIYVHVYISGFNVNFDFFLGVIFPVMPLKKTNTLPVARICFYHNNIYYVYAMLAGCMRAKKSIASSRTGVTSAALTTPSSSFHQPTQRCRRTSISPTTP